MILSASSRVQSEQVKAVKSFSTAGFEEAAFYVTSADDLPFDDSLQRGSTSHNKLLNELKNGHFLDSNLQKENNAPATVWKTVVPGKDGS